MIKIAIAQFQSSVDKNVNLQAALELIDQAKRRGAAMIAFPEFLMAYSPAGQSAAALSEVAESTDGAFIRSLRAAAKNAGIGVVNLYEPARSRTLTTAPYGSTGPEPSPPYRKLISMTPSAGESDKFHPGDDVAPLASVGESRFGAVICYDLRSRDGAHARAARRER
jgi:predicted amidohydrolase